MQRLEVSDAVRPIYGSLGFKRLMFERLALKAVMQNDGEFVDVILLYTADPQVLLRVKTR